MHVMILNTRPNNIYFKVHVFFTQLSGDQVSHVKRICVDNKYMLGRYYHTNFT